MDFLGRLAEERNVSCVQKLGGGGISVMGDIPLSPLYLVYHIGSNKTLLLILHLERAKKKKKLEGNNHKSVMNGLFWKCLRKAAQAPMLTWNHSESAQAPMLPWNHSESLLHRKAAQTSMLTWNHSESLLHRKAAQTSMLPWNHSEYLLHRKAA